MSCQGLSMTTSKCLGCCKQWATFEAHSILLLLFFQSPHRAKTVFKCTIKVELNFGTCGTPGNKKCIHLIFEITFDISCETDWFHLLWVSLLRLRVVDCNTIFKGKKLVNCFRKIISGWWSETEETNAAFITNNLLTLWQNTSMHDLFATGKWAANGTESWFCPGVVWYIWGRFLRYLTFLPICLELWTSRKYQLPVGLHIYQWSKWLWFSTSVLQETI